MADEKLIAALRAALEATPDNTPLRQHLADLLLANGDYAAAEKEFRAVLAQSIDDEAPVKLALAQAFFHQEKWLMALVVLEELMRASDPVAHVYAWAARAYWQTSQLERARAAYAEAINRDPALADADLAAKLESDATPEPFPPPAMSGLDQAAPGPGRDQMDDTGDDDDQRVRVPVADWPQPETGEEIERSGITFADVGGMDALKDQIRMKIIHPLNNPDIYRAYGKSVGGGILMYGPPGCGKTHLARATAGEVDAYFLAIGIHDVLDMYLGQSEQKLHGLFEMARRNTPCVIFIDEADALGADRTDMRRSAGRQVINQLLAELDGIDHSNDGVLVLAATNAPWHLDPALRRPGRFDRVIFVPPPDAQARAAILQVMLRDKPCGHIDYAQLGKRTGGFSGADLKAVVDSAIEDKLREAMHQGTPQPITTKDLLSAVRTVKPSTKDWFGTARNYALYANQSGTYDEVLDFLKRSEDSAFFSRLAFWKDE